MVDQSLKILIRQFVYEVMPYAEFRAHFVANFLSVRRSPDSDGDRDVNAIESACADFDEGYISVEEMRDDLSSTMLADSGSSAATVYRQEMFA